MLSEPELEVDLCRPIAAPSDPGRHHRVLPHRGVHRSVRSARDAAEVHRTSDHHPHRGPHRAVGLPGCRREGGETLGHRHAVSLNSVH